MERAMSRWPTACTLPAFSSTIPSHCHWYSNTNAVHPTVPMA